MKRLCCVIAWIGIVSKSLFAQPIVIEAEHFSSPGGWKIDTQFVEQMGSVYMLAHGLGTPVEDATTTFIATQASTRHLWARTRNWVAGYTNEQAPGRFQIIINGTTQAVEFGATRADWHWQYGGVCSLVSGENRLALHDLTGFDGRCDAIVFTETAEPPPAEKEALAAWRLAATGTSLIPDDVATYDLVVVGGGMGGCAAALAAARSGLHVALVQDRPVFGGNASQEIRVKTEGELRYSIVNELRNTQPNGASQTIADDAQRLSVLQAEPTLTLYSGWRAYQVSTHQNAIQTVDIRKIDTPEQKRLHATLFADCTGDAWIGYWAGADYRMGREAQSEYNESLAPLQADAMTMGNTLMWSTKTNASPSAFPTLLPWTTNVAGTAAMTSGGWDWEYGMSKDTIENGEEIRDHLLRAIYGNFANAKKLGANANRSFDWVPYVAGKRESRRLLGDHVLTQNDMVNGQYFEDAVLTTDWGIDLHFETSTSYKSSFNKTEIVSPCYLPYRTLYSRNIRNLFMAGRNFSCTHVGLGSPRVMNTVGQMGVVVGYAAAICVQQACTPRDVYRDPTKMQELQARLTGNWIKTSSWPTNVWEVARCFTIDNANASRVYTLGAWTSSASDSGYYGANYLHDGNTNKGKKRVVFTYAPAVTGTYHIAIRNPASGSKATNAPIWVFTQPDSIRCAPSDQRTLQAGSALSSPIAPILVGRVPTTNYHRGLIQFDLSTLPSNCIIASAKLTLIIAKRDPASVTGPMGTGGVTIQAVTEAYTPNEVTWRMRSATAPWSMPGGTLDTNILTSISDPIVASDVVVGQRFAFPETRALLAAVMAAQTNTPAPWMTLCVRTPGLEQSYAGQKLYGFEHAELELTYDDMTRPPTARIDQSKNAGVLHDLGTYAQTPQGFRVVVGNDATTAYVVADAVQFTCTSLDMSDYDGNGLPNIWERFYFMQETGTSSRADADGDGRSNWIEYKTGTSPTDARDFYDLRTALHTPAKVSQEPLQLAWNSAAGLRYRIDVSTNLTAFTPYITGIEATPPTNLYTVFRTKACEFFRIVVEE